MSLGRWWRHLIAEGAARRRFPPRVLDSIQREIAAGEATHRGQVCFALESALPAAALWRGVTVRARAEHAFGVLRVWDTEHNSGVLIYVLLAERAIEIIADRGIAARVAPAEWQAIVDAMQARFAAGEFEAGALQAVRAVGAVLQQHFPRDGTAVANELPDRPVVL